jgi:hypothetical protein
MPSERKRAMTAPMIPKMGTPKYITAAGLTSSATWTKFIQTRTNADTSATPMADRYAIVSTFLVTSSYVRTKWFPSKGISRKSAVNNAGPFQRLSPPSPPSALPAAVLRPWMSVFIGPLRSITLHYKVA